MYPPLGGAHIKRVENYLDFDKLVHVIQHGLQGFIVKNMPFEGLNFVKTLEKFGVIYTTDSLLQKKTTIVCLC